MEWGRTMGIVEGLDILDGGLLARVHQCDVALTAHRQQAVAHGQAHHLLAVFQPNLRRSPSRFNKWKMDTFVALHCARGLQ